MDSAPGLIRFWSRRQPPENLPEIVISLSRKGGIARPFFPYPTNRFSWGYPMNKFRFLCAASALIFPGAAMAQSTGTVDFEEEAAIVVTGTRTSHAPGVEIPDTSKTRQALNAEFIQRQTPGQSINETINNLPGVSFTNNDPF